MSGKRAFVMEVTENPTRFFSEITGHLSMDSGSVHEQIAGLEKQGLVKGYEMDIDMEAVEDREFIAVIGYESNAEQFADLVDEIEGRDEVREFVTDDEIYHLLLEASFEDAEHLHEFTAHFDEERGVHRVSPAVILRKV